MTISYAACMPFKVLATKFRGIAHMPFHCQKNPTSSEISEHFHLAAGSEKNLGGGLEHFLFFHILGIIIPTDELHDFSEG